MSVAENAPEQDHRIPAGAIPIQRDAAWHDRVTADDRLVELLRHGLGDDVDDPVIRSLARWRARIVEGT
jgi:hypothetical protein